MNRLRSTELSANVIALLLSTVYMHYSQFSNRSEVAPGLRKGSKQIIRPRSVFVKGPLPPFNRHGLRVIGAAKTTLGGGRILE